MAQAAGLSLDTWQEQVLTSTSKTILLNCSRQSGKSLVCALSCMHSLLFSDQTIVLCSPSERQSKEIHRTILTINRKLGKPIKVLSVGKTHLDLHNNSRVLALPGAEDSIRGIASVTKMVVDEAARVPDAVFSALSPMLAVQDGTLLAPSTGRGKRGWWYGLVTSDDPDVEVYEIPASKISRIKSDFLRREQERLGDHMFRQEYLCEFLDDTSAAFRSEDINTAVEDDLDYDYELASLLAG